MKFLLDMNMPDELGRLLQSKGHPSRHVRILGLQKAQDSEILEIARVSDEVVLTHDLDFGKLLAFSGASEPSVVIFRCREARAQSLFDGLNRHREAVDPALEEGAVVIIEDDAVRIRRLPIE